MIACCWALAGAGIASILWAALGSGSRSGDGDHTVVDAFLGAVRQPSPGEFPTPASAIKFLVEQVRTQDLADVTRVVPITELYEHETFEWRASWLQSVDVQSFFPGQPLSKLESVAMGPLGGVYTRFAVELLDPELGADGTVVLSTPAAVRRLEARLDPKRLANIYVRSVKVDGVRPASKTLGPGHDPSITQVAAAEFVVAGVAHPHGFDVELWKVGTNWLVTGLSPA